MDHSIKAIIIQLDEGADELNHIGSHAGHEGRDEPDVDDDGRGEQKDTPATLTEKFIYGAIQVDSRKGEQQEDEADDDRDPDRSGLDEEAIKYRCWLVHDELLFNG